MVELCPKGSTAQPDRGVTPRDRVTKTLNASASQGLASALPSYWHSGLGRDWKMLPHQARINLEGIHSHQPLCLTAPRHPTLGPAPHSGPTASCELTEVSFQPLVSLDELVNQCKVVGVGLIWHHPASRRDLQLPVSDQPAGEATIRMGWGPVPSPLANQPMSRPACTRTQDQDNTAILPHQPALMPSGACISQDWVFVSRGRPDALSLLMLQQPVSPNTRDPHTITPSLS